MPPKITLKVGELFAGVGGLGLGFILADHPFVRFQPLFALDSDEKAIDSYRVNTQWLMEHAPDVLPHTPVIYHKPVEDLDVEETLREHGLVRGELDILIGGPPCQGLSSANRQSGQERRTALNNLIRVFLEKVVAFQPKMFLIENVQGVKWSPPTGSMQGSVIQTSIFPEMDNTPTDIRAYLVQFAQELGYKVWHDIIDAADYGVPQHRQRFFLFGVRSDLFQEQNVEIAHILRKKRCNEPVTVLHAIGDLPPVGNGQHWISGDYTIGEGAYIRWLRRYMSDNSLYDHFTTKHKEYVLERFARIPEGSNWESIRELMSTTYTAIDNTHSNIYRRLQRNAPAHTISHYRKSMTIHPIQDRGLSFREACRLQSFPDWFRFLGPRDEGQQQHLANAVPPLLAAAVAWAIGEFWHTITDTANCSATTSELQQDFFLLIDSYDQFEKLSLPSSQPSQLKEKRPSRYTGRSWSKRTEKAREYDQQL